MTAIRWSVITLAVALAGTLRGGDWWVDSMGAGDGTTSGTPTASVQAAINAASSGDTINIRGAAGRLYTNTAYKISKPLTLRDWEGKPIFRLTNTVDSLASRLVNVASSSVTLRNLRFEILGNAIGSGDDIVEITTNEFSTGAAHNVTLDGCEFAMTAFGGLWDQGYPVQQGTPPYGTNIQIRSCLFANWDYGTGDGYRLFMIGLNGDRSLVVDNTFTNTSKILSGLSRYTRISGNRILNCRNNLKLRDNVSGGVSYGGMIRTGYNILRDCEISYNVVWNNNGLRTSFLDKQREGFTGNTRIFNNTVYNADGLVSSQYYSAGSQWSPLIYNNLLINNAYANIYSITNSTMTGTNTFLVATQIKNNLWYGGANTLIDPASVSVTPVNCYNVSCVLLNTNDTGNVDFLRPDGTKTPQVLQGIGGIYPSYIGALQPKVGVPVTVLLLR